jgi:hypothetical protein
MNSGHLIPGMKQQDKPASGNRRRDTERGALCGHATYNYKEGPFIYKVAGVIRDLSPTGCGIGGRMPQMVGSQIRVMLFLPDEQPPLSISAIVSWVAGDFFGVKFPKLKSSDHNRLQQHIRKMAG